MKKGHFSEHWTTDDGMPSGGISTGTGFTISWQNGPLGTGNARRLPNGAFVEDVLDAVIGRIAFYQTTIFACGENARALMALHQAAEALDARTRERVARQVEGTHSI